MPQKKPAKTRKDKLERISQSDVPSSSLTNALRVAQAIYDNFGGKPTRGLQIASAMNMSPTSGPFKMLTGASIAYGITEGGYNAESIKLTALGKRIVSPTAEGDDRAAKREAVLMPRVVSEFFKKYDNAPFPQPKIALNVLEEMGVPRDRTEKTLALIEECGNEVGFFTNIKGKKYVDLSEAGENASISSEVTPETQTDEESPESEPAIPAQNAQRKKFSKQNEKLVFVTHGKDRSFLEPIKKMLSYSGLEPVIAVERATVSQSMTTKVLEGMRNCSAAIIHVDAESRIVDENGKEHVFLNPNVLIEIGAAIALYGSRFILLVKDGIELPTNLKGLFEVRYIANQLSSDETLKLLDAINDMKNRPLV